ncbi:hypothetical protein chiPu_0026706 [Chiloscyllium punctatum]|uniref:Uncharacterized protein n=1 Tax=Chiloscyllium punctatum TaxID=137246 RepID=A0A401TJ89_CHIPU|nr:hypothetical protein [Chiloscyllium punctatum]
MDTWGLYGEQSEDGFAGRSWENSVKIGSWRTTGEQIVDGFTGQSGVGVRDGCSEDKVRVASQTRLPREPSGTLDHRPLLGQQSGDGVARRCSENKTGLGSQAVDRVEEWECCHMKLRANRLGTGSQIIAMGAELGWRHGLLLRKTAGMGQYQENTGGCGLSRLLGNQSRDRLSGRCWEKGVRTGSETAAWRSEWN